MEVWYKVIISLVCLGLVHSQSQTGWYITNGTDILYTTSDTSQPKSIYHNIDARIVGLAVDVADNLIFWSDISLLSRGIYKASLNGGNTVNNAQKIISEDTGEINGITVDWVRNLIYWTDSGKRSIEVAKYDGSIRHVLSIHGLLQPRGIFADPVSSALYWNDQGTRKIEKSALDGSGRMTIATGSSNESPYWPNQMTVSKGKLYYVDGFTLEVVQYDVNNINTKKVIGTLSPFGATSKDSPPFGISVDAAFAYVSIWHTGKIGKLSLDGRNNPGIVFQNLGIDAIFSIIKVDTNMQPQGGSNPCASKTCTGGICLISSNTVAKCVCQSFGAGSPKTLNSQGTTCTVPDNLLFYVLADEGIVGYRDITGSSDNNLYIVGRSSRPVAVAYDSVNGYVYWSDVHERNVHKAKLDGTSHTIFMSSSSHSIGIVDGLAVDSLHGNLYYTNMGTIELHNWEHRWHKIEFISLDGKNRRKTIVESAEKPRALYVDSAAGYVYYSDWGSKAAVIRVELDGSKPFVIRGNGLDNPNAITIDGNYIYVVDSHYKTRNPLNPNYPVPKVDGALYRVEKSGNSWQKLSGTSLTTPFGITSYNGNLYISDWDKKSVIKATPGSAGTDVLTNVAYPMALLYSKRTTTQNTHSCSSSSCQEICTVSVPSSVSKCTCDSYNPLVSSASTCASPTNFILVGDFNSIKLISQDGNAVPSNHLVQPQVITSGSSYFSNFVSLAYDSTNKVYYYTDVNRKAIYSSKLDGSETKMVYDTKRVIDGMDMHGGKLYWTAYSEGSIYRTDLSTNKTDKIVDTLSRPRAIQVTDQFIYWTEWGAKPRVAKTPTTSPGQITVVTDSNLVRPNGLHVREFEDKIYIGDVSTNAQIIECTLNGVGCKNILPLANAPKHIYSVKKHGSMIYFTDWDAGTLSMFDITSKRIIQLAKNLMRPTEIVLKLGNVGTCPGGHGCSGSCMPYVGGYFCTCSGTKILDVNQKTCINGDPYLACDASKCASCSANQVCSQKPGDASCSCVCKAGYTGSPPCQKCTSGQYKPYKGNEACKACPSGTSSSSSDATGCQCSTNAWNWKTETCLTSKTGTCPNYYPVTCPSTACTSDSQCDGASRCCTCQGNKKCMDPNPNNLFTQCVYNGKIYSAGEKFKPDTCIMCTCMRDKTYGNPQYGYAECHIRNCPALDCKDTEQVLRPGDCCKTCDLKCSQQPVTIVECQGTGLVKTLNLAQGDFAVQVTNALTLTPRDNCNLDRTVNLKIEPNKDLYVWQKEPYRLTATASALKADGTPDEFVCNIQLKVKDPIQPTIKCPADATYPKSNCISLPNPTFSDNVCGKVSGSQCSLTSSIGSCLKLETDTNVQYTVTDGEGNSASCSYRVSVLQSTPNVPCTPPGIDFGKFECSGQNCQVKCSAGYYTDLLNGQINFACSANGAWEPALRSNIQKLACTERGTIKIIGTLRVTNLPCPLYPKSLLRLGLREELAGPNYARNPNIVKSGSPISVDVISEGCLSSRKKRSTNDFIIGIELIAEEKDRSKEEPIKQDIKDLTSIIDNDLRNGKLSWKGAPTQGIQPEKTDPIRKCQRGQVKYTVGQEEGCISCPAGTKQNGTKCEPCGLNTYQDMQQTTYCFPCLDGKVTQEVGASLEQQCVKKSELPTTKALGDDGSNLGIIIGVVVAVVVVIIVIVVAVVVVMIKRKKPGNEEKRHENLNHQNHAFQGELNEKDIHVDMKYEEKYEEIPADRNNGGQLNPGQYEELGSFNKEKESGPYATMNTGQQ